MRIPFILMAFLPALSFADQSALHLAPGYASLERVIEVPGDRSQTIEIGGIPAYVSMNQIRYSAKNGSVIDGARLLATKEAEGETQARELELAIEMMELQLRDLRLVSETLKTQYAMVEDVRWAPESNLEPERLLSFIQETHERLRKKNADTYKAIIESESKLKKLKAQREQIGQPRDGEKTLVFTVRGQGDLQVQYPLRHIYHSVNYTLDLDTDEEALSIKPQLELSNRSDQAFELDQLVLHSAAPSWKLTHSTPLDALIKEASKLKASPRGATAALMARQADALFEESTLNGVAVQQQRRGVNFRQTITSKIKLSGDGSVQSVKLPSIDLAARIYTRIVPDVESQAYLYAEYTVPWDQIIAEGPAKLFRDDAYVGQAHMTLAWDNTEIHQGFGPDPGLTFQFKKSPRFEADGFIGRGKVFRQQYLVKAQNHYLKPRDVEVIGIYPHSTHDDIKITPLGDSKFLPFENRVGLVIFKRTLKPGEKLYLDYGHEVKTPDDFDLSWPE